MKKKSLMQSRVAAPHIVWSVLFIVAPLLIVAYYAFTTAEGNFTLENMFALSEHSHTFAMSIAMSVIATLSAFWWAIRWRM